MKVLFTSIILLALTSCASKQDKLEIQRKAQDSKISDSKALGQSISETIQNSETLTATQKKELEDIIAINKGIAETLTQQSYQYRSLLVQNLLSGNVNQKEINIIKKDIRRIEAEKLKNTFDTVEKITKIVSKNPGKDKFTNQIINFDRNIR